MSEQQIEVPKMKEPFELRVAHFIIVIKGKEEAVCSGADGLRALLVCEAIRVSMNTGQPVNVE
jgi:predicted dehydrogenase